MRGKERDNSPFPLPHSPFFFFFCASSMIWTLGTTRRLLEPIHLHHAAIGPQPHPLYAMSCRCLNYLEEITNTPTFEWRMHYFVLLGDSASTILSACITGALWTKQGERGARSARRGEKNTRDPHARLALCAKCRVRLYSCTLLTVIPSFLL